MTTAATTAVKDCVLAGFGGSCPARVTVTHYERTDRWRRGLQALARAWGIALVCVFIPVAHLVLVPSFLLYGIWSGWQRLTTVEAERALREAPRRTRRDRKQVVDAMAATLLLRGWLDAQASRERDAAR